MDNREIAIRLSGVKKMYRLGQIGGGTLTADLQSWWARIRGKEDPNTIIGTTSGWPVRPSWPSTAST